MTDNTREIMVTLMWVMELFNQFFAKTLQRWYFHILKEPLPMFFLANAVQDVINEHLLSQTLIYFPHVLFWLAYSPYMLFLVMWSTSMKNTFKDNYVHDFYANNAHPEEPLFSATWNRMVTVMYFMCVCLYMKLKLECLSGKLLYSSPLQKID